MRPAWMRSCNLGAALSFPARPCRIVSAGMLAACCATGSAWSQSSGRGAAVETEHMFGFTLGSDIGRPGEGEVELTNIGRFGRQADSYSVLSTTAEYKYPLTGEFRVSGEATVSYFGVSGAPALDDRSQVVFDNVALELDYRLLDRRKAALGLTLIAAPFLAFANDASGAAASRVGATFVVAADRELIPGTFAAINLVYGFDSGHELATGLVTDISGLGFQVAASRRLFDWLYVGAEARYLRSYDGAGLNALSGQAVYVGPVFLAPIAKGIALSGAWSMQVWGQSAGDLAGLDLLNFERQQALLRLEIDF